MSGLARRDFLSGAAALAASTASAATGSPRRFRMGTTRWPPDLTLAALGMVERFIRDECDMAAPMVLGGVPWVAAEAGQDFSPRLMSELTWRPPQGHGLCLSLGPLNTMRDGLAPLYGETDNLPLPPDWADLPFDHPRVVDAYAAFCARAAMTMKPDWLVTGVEVNILLHKRPEAFPALVTLLEEAARQVRQAAPNTRVGLSVTLTHLFGLSDGADAGTQRDTMIRALEHADFAGLSVYPHTSWDIPQPVPEGWYDRITEFSRSAGKPVAVTESGMTSESFMAGFIPIRGSDERQEAHLQSLLSSAERGDWLFVVNWTSHDYPDLMKHIPRDIRWLAKVWTYTGLRTGDGQDKPVMDVWRAAMGRGYTR